jgi:predicted amidohydrolase
MKTIRIAAVIFHSQLARKRENLERMDFWVAAARKDGAEIICFPELNITGYGTGAAVQETAEEVPGPATDSLCVMARNHGVVILAGMAEKASDGRVFASHLAADPAGMLGVYRKAHIAPPEETTFSAGSSIPVLEAAGMRFGIQLCYDAHFSELTTRMAQDGADVIFMPHASPRGTPEEKRASWMRHLPARAFDHAVFVVACNQTGDNGSGLAFPGLAIVLGPDGKVIAECISHREALLIADLEAESLSAVRTHPMRYFLPRRRPEIYRFAATSAHGSAPR